MAMQVELQQEIHDPVKAGCHMQDFTWTMAKLKLQINESLDNPNSKLTQQIELRNDKKHYQHVKLSNSNSSKNVVT